MMGNQYRITAYCRFCGFPFLGSYGDVRLVMWFCPRCRDLYQVALESVIRFEQTRVLHRDPELPHCVLIMSNGRAM